MTIKLRPLVLLAASALALAGCSSTPTTATKVDQGPIRARTFNYVNTGSKPAPSYADNQQAVHAMVQSAITRNLAARGLQQVASGGDVTVGYLIIVGNNASISSINDYFSYGEDSTELSDKAFDAYTGSKNPNYFEAGTLLIDVVDTKSHKLLKRNYATRPIIRDVTNATRAARIQEVVDEILRDVRIAQ